MVYSVYTVYCFTLLTFCDSLPDRLLKASWSSLQSNRCRRGGESSHNQTASRQYLIPLIPDPLRNSFCSNCSFPQVAGWGKCGLEVLFHALAMVLNILHIANAFFGSDCWIGLPKKPQEAFSSTDRYQDRLVCLHNLSPIFLHFSSLPEKKSLNTYNYKLMGLEISVYLLFHTSVLDTTVKCAMENMETELCVLKQQLHAHQSFYSHPHITDFGGL